MNPGELDKALREFRKDHPPQEPKRRKRPQTRMDQLIDCIEAQLDAAFSEPDTAPPVA